MHGSEPAGPAGLLAFVYSLVQGKSLDGGELATWRDETLEKQTIVIVPQLNVDGAERFAERVPDCWWRNRYPYADETAWDEIWHMVDDPLKTFYGDTFHRTIQLPQDQLQNWLKEGGVLGMRFNDDGVDLWRDFGEVQFSPETKAITRLLGEYPPDCAVDIHNDAIPSCVYAPTVNASEEDGRRQVAYAHEIFAEVQGAGLPCSTAPIRPYGAEPNAYINFVYDKYRCNFVFFEINNGIEYPYAKRLWRGTILEGDIGFRPPNQEEVVRTVWLMLHRLVELGNKRKYR